MSTATPESVGVEIENLNLSFGETQVLKGVDLTIRQGEFFAFLGPSGSGKSTLLRAIAGFGPKPSGRILIDKQDVADLPPWKRDVGMVFQNYALWPHMTVHKNVAFGLEERKLPRREIEQRVGHALEMVGLADYAGRRPSQLSGGQQQRVALARTVVIEPKVLLLDEPLSNLDANLRVQMRRDIRALQRKLGLTTIFVTHDQEEANTTADRMAVLDQGVIQQVGSPMDLYDNPANLFVARFLGSANILEGRLEQSDGRIVFVTGHGLSLPLNEVRNGARFAVFRPQNVEILRQGTPAAEDGSIRLSGRVGEVEFLGTTIRYVVDVGGDAIVVDHAHRQGEIIFDPGAPVDLAVDREGVMLLSA